MPLFQSTSSVWRTTTIFCPSVVSMPISIHVLRVEDDSIMAQCTGLTWISIHVLRVEDDEVAK